MALPVPNLDDRRFQDLVDDAKRQVQQRCPEWTDHNVSDPGVTIIELFAWMTDQVLYRLNRVPDRNYVKFLEMIGVKLFPPTAARAPVTFWLSAAAKEVLSVPAGTQVGTLRTETEAAVIFTTVDGLKIVPVTRGAVATAAGDGAPEERTADLDKGEGFLCFEKEPKPGDALLVGLSDAAPSCAVTLRFKCDIEGVGVDPDWPPLAWDAWNGEAWEPCEVDRDATGGLNKDGDLVLHVPKTHAVSVIAKQRAGWLRARVTEAEEDQPPYSASPNIKALSVFTIGGTADAIHGDVVTDEQIGVSEGVAGQRFALKRRPVTPGETPEVLEVSDGAGWAEWTQVPDFAGSGPDDKHFVLDATTGEIQLGPAVRERDGRLVNYGAVPPKDAHLRVRSYRTGGGRAGNLAAGALSVMKSSIPFVARVENRHAAQGGVEGEDIEDAKIRGPITLRTRGRAVTVEDFEHLAREAAPEVARVRCVPAATAEEAGGVRVLVVPAAAGGGSARLHFEQLLPAEETLEKIVARLDECRLVGTRLLVEPPSYQGITVVARLKARPRVNAVRLQQQALEALYSYFHPISGGPDGTGWPFGRPVQVGEVYAVLQSLRGTEMVEDARLFGADPITGKRGEQTQRLDIDPHALVFSYEHQVLAEGQ